MTSVRESKKRKKKSREDEKGNKAPVVCLTCRSLKKKCDGGSPCARCVEKGCADSCQLAVPRKRGRRSREELAAEAAAMAEAANAAKGGRVALIRSPDSTDGAMVTPLATGVVTDMVLGPAQATLLSLLMDYSSKALAERPADVVAAFGLSRLDHGFVAFALPSLNAYSDPLTCFMDALIVSGSLGFAKVPGTLFDPSRLVGRTLQELAASCGSSTQIGEIKRVLMTPPPVTGRPWIRRFRHRKIVVAPSGRVEELLIEDTMFMDG